MKRKRSCWSVKWRIATPSGAFVFRTKDFPLPQFDAMTAFMADRIEEVGIHRVSLAKYDAYGRLMSTPAQATYSGGCSRERAPSLADENFGTFSGIPG
jgi:hypothetical protein